MKYQSGSKLAERKLKVNMATKEFDTTWNFSVEIHKNETVTANLQSKHQMFSYYPGGAASEAIPTDTSTWDCSKGWTPDLLIGPDHLSHSRPHPTLYLFIFPEAGHGPSLHWVLPARLYLQRDPSSLCETAQLLANRRLHLHLPRGPEMWLWCLPDQHHWMYNICLAKTIYLLKLYTVNKHFCRVKLEKKGQKKSGFPAKY